MQVSKVWFVPPFKKLKTLCLTENKPHCSGNPDCSLFSDPASYSVPSSQNNINGKKNQQHWFLGADKPDRSSMALT